MSAKRFLAVLALAGAIVLFAGYRDAVAEPSATLAAAPPVVPPPPPPPPPNLPEDFTLAVLPDTQYYSAKYPQHWQAVSKWLAANAQSHNIKYVIGVGDITDDNSERQWTVAQENLNRIQAVVPVALTLGNHDYGRGPGPTGRGTRFEQFFPVADFTALPTAGGLYQPDSLANSYHLFAAGGREWLILCLEFGPRDEVVAWANQVLADHRERIAIITTHAYLTNDGPRLDQFDPVHGHNPHSYPHAKAPGGVNDGEELWQKLVKPNANVAFVLCGHISGVSRQTSTNDAGYEVHEMLADYQSEKEGGMGYIRLLKFPRDLARLDVRSYSPVQDREKKVSLNRFSLDLSKTVIGAPVAAP